MQFKNLLPAGFGLLTLLTSVNAAPVIPVESTNSSPTHCDFYCAHHLLFRTAYTSAGKGFGMVLDTCDALAWCVNEAKDSCPNAINATLTTVASRAKSDTTAGLDYNNFTNLALLSAMNAVSARSARIAISMAQSLLDSGNKSCSEDAATQLEGIRWFMAQQEGPIDYDADKFEEDLSSMEDEPGGQGLERRDDGDSDDDSNGLLGLLGLLGVPVLGVGGHACLQYDWIICKQITQLLRLLKGGKKILPETNIAKTIMQESAEALSEASSSTDAETRYAREEFKKIRPRVKEYVRKLPKDYEPVPRDVLPQPGEAHYPYYPPNPQDDLPLGATRWSPPGKYPTGTEQERPPSGPEPPNVPRPPNAPPTPPIAPTAEGAELFRAETYHPITGEVTQVTVTASITQEPDVLGFPAWDVLNAAGERVQTIWRSPQALSPMPGHWASMPSASDQFVRAQANQVTGEVEPVLDCLGQPVVASASGVLNNLVPAAYAASEGVAGSLGPGLGMLFNILRAADDVSRTDTIIFNPTERMVDIHDAISDSQNGSENEDDQPAEEQNKSDGDGNEAQEADIQPHEGDEESDGPPTSSMSATATHYSHATLTQTSISHDPDNGEFSSAQKIDQPTQTSVTQSVQEADQSNLPNTEQTTVQSTPASSSKSTASPTKSSTLVVSTTYITSVLSTLITTTTPGKSQSSQANNAFPTLTHVAGCKTIQDCPCGRDGPSCQIGDLPLECLVGASQIDRLAFMGNTTWDECVTKIQKLEREEAKAWAAAITLPYCLSHDEWEPKDNGKGHGGECYLTFRGEEFAKVAYDYVQGMLPLECPTSRQAQSGDKNGDGHWDEYSEDLEQRCRRAADILGQPFLDFAKANHSVVDTWKEAFCSTVLCFRDDRQH